MTPPSSSASRRVADYQQRKVEGRCTYPGCPLDAADDSVQCPGHRDAARKRVRRHLKAKRRDRRAKGRCADCGRRSLTYRCPACLVRTGAIPTTNGNNRDNNEVAPRVKVERASRGRRAVPRYVGRARRGAPSAALLDEQDLDAAVAEALKAKAALAYAKSPAVQALPKIQRDDVEAAALARLDAAERWFDEVRSRHRRKSA